MHVSVCVAQFILVGSSYTHAYGTNFVMNFITTYVCMYHMIGTYVAQTPDFTHTCYQCAFFLELFQLAVWSPCASVG